ncbi:hypothetical protein [Parvularcula sp. IMCC14364]|uniref:hypothetical protein n=1 Tax=Parvularcula sp. IMCC14364 TaxID=3067902 RepID=UPI002741AC6A|nr:hypothetical protein [Parvularcula sp. IMCC14364]
MKFTFLSIAMITATLAACTTPASAASRAQGQWVLDAARCPDLVEDRRDRRESRRDEAFDRNRRDVIKDRLDRRESRRDEMVTRCPASAWVWQGPAWRNCVHPARPASVRVYYKSKSRSYYRYGNQNRRVVVIKL